MVQVKVKFFIRPYIELAQLELDINAFLVTLAPVNFVDSKLALHNDGAKLVVAVKVIYKE